MDRNDVAGLAEMLDLLPERVVRYRVRDQSIVYCNAAWAAGYGLVPDDVVGRRLLEFLSPGGLVGFHRQIARLGPDTPVLADEEPREDGDRWYRWVDRYHPSGEVIAVGRDVTEQHLAEQRLADSEARFRELADHSVDVVWRLVYEPELRFDYISPSVEQMLGHTAEWFMEDFRRMVDMLDAEGAALVADAMRGIPFPPRSDLRYRRPDGSVIIAEMQISPVPGGVQGVSRDVTELRRLQEHLSTLALRDPLTGLANRRLLQELLEAGLARTKRTGEPLAVAYVDLDEFKSVNDSFGHDAGDTVLCETARRLVAVARSADAVARVGGDEFVVVYEPGAVGADQLVARLDAALAAPLTVAGTTVSCRASIGQADTCRFGHDAGVLLAAADAAMFEVKRVRVHAHARTAIGH